MGAHQNRLVELMQRQRNASRELADEVRLSIALVREAERLLELEGSSRTPPAAGRLGPRP